MVGYQFDCEFCDWTAVAASADELKARGKRHLADDHAEDLAPAFADDFGGVACRNECGYVFPVDEAAESECPTCGHDNFPAFLERYVYWRIESA